MKIEINMRKISLQFPIRNEKKKSIFYSIIQIIASIHEFAEV